MLPGAHSGKTKYENIIKVAEVYAKMAIDSQLRLLKECFRQALRYLILPNQALQTDAQARS